MIFRVQESLGDVVINVLNTSNGKDAILVRVHVGNSRQLMGRVKDVEWIGMSRDGSCFRGT